jgi:CDP-diacylglycerol--serine O-phosphatidyltransferase
MTEPSDLRRTGQDLRKHRRGIFLLPSLLTVGNLFCGYACVQYTMRGELVTAAPFIGIAIILDMLDGRIARLTNTTSAFGVEFDSLADVISFGLAPAVLVSGWGLLDLGRVGWAASFVYVGAAAMRLARFNIQPGSLDKRYFVGMPTPAAAGIIAATVFAWPYPLTGRPFAWAAIAVVLVPAALMVSTIRFRSFKTINLGWGSLRRLLIFMIIVAFVATEPRFTLVLLAYGYLVWAFVEMAITRHRARRDGTPPAPVPPVTSP